MTKQLPSFFDRTCADLVQAAGEQRLRQTWGRDEEARQVLGLLRERRSVLLLARPASARPPSSTGWLR